MKQWLLRGGLVGTGLVLVSIAVNYAMSDRVLRSGDKVDRLVGKLHADASRLHPDLPVSEARRQTAVGRSSEMLNAETSDERRRTLAADMFWGFYLVNVRARSEICAEYGVNIAAFVRAFEATHTREVARARWIYARSRPGYDVDNTYAQLRQQMRTQVLQDLKDIALGQRVAVPDVCQYLAQDASAVSQAMHLSKAQPTVFNDLNASE